ncbi:MAG: AraC family transcriptional regulator [Pseudomonas sp.]|uniref:helix-turn-helix transcriptional regulator n=1 Tax=Pseudomonas abieticivorans TaxID=2931382 RepID=UPI0020BDA701|nr:AraC family transcriptional regulator [Pseudomonas sp. PIA16]MDE1164619.1 AraC family transcriptional regulator [Pseudomonas sp.]
MENSRFWRDPAVPFIEARDVLDGRHVCYARHSHESFSIGAIVSGHSTYLNGRARHRVGQGTVVVMNPGDVHACNPLQDQPWAYRMLYLDTPWLTELQHQMGLGAHQDLRTFATTHSDDPRLFAGLNGLYATLTNADLAPLAKHSATIEFFTLAQQCLDPLPQRAVLAHDKLGRAADFIRANCTGEVTLAEICSVAQLSPSYLIRAFKQQYGLTPHGYLTDCRIQFARAQLRRGRAIAEAALDAGFADQAHLQRVFKQHLAATPGHYRAHSSIR